MKQSIFIIALALFTSCSIIMPTYTYKQALSTSTSQEWAAGVRNGGRGVTFRVTFYQLDEELKADTLWVNNYPLETEITRVGDTTYITSFIHVLDDQPEQPLIKDDVYSGKLQVYIKDKKKELDVGSFRALPSTQYP